MENLRYTLYRGLDDAIYRVGQPWPGKLGTPEKNIPPAEVGEIIPIPIESAAPFEVIIVGSAPGVDGVLIGHYWPSGVYLEAVCPRAMFTSYLTHLLMVESDDEDEAAQEDPGEPEPPAEPHPEEDKDNAPELAP